MKKRILYIVVFMLVLAGCGSTSFAILKDVPSEPSFVVIPVNPLLYQVEFANSVEEVVLGCGVTIFQRPAKKSITITKNAEKSVDKAEYPLIKGGKAEMSMIEQFYQYEKIKADYIIITNEYSNQIRIIKKDTEQVMASFNAGYGKTIEFEDTIRNALKSMGIPIREKD